MAALTAVSSSFPSAEDKVKSAQTLRTVSLTCLCSLSKMTFTSVTLRRASFRQETAIGLLFPSYAVDRSPQTVIFSVKEVKNIDLESRHSVFVRFATTEAF